jgi:hypothetical protein
MFAKYFKMAKEMRSAFFWVITQRVMVIPYRRFGEPICPIFKGHEFRELFINLRFILLLRR